MMQRSSARIALCAISVFAILQFSWVPEAEAQRGFGRPSATTDGKLSKFVEPLANKDLEQFRGYVSEEIGPGWTIEGKHLVYDGSGGGDIMTKETYSDFELQVDWQIQEGGNSGIMFRVTTGDDAPYMSGPEFQILDDETHADGKSELTSAGALYGLYPATGKKARAAGTWNKSRIIVEGNKITHYLNGTKVVEAEIGSEDWNKRLAESKFKDWEKFAKASSGHICFQDHGDPVRFRNIRIKPLGESSNVTEASGSRDEAGRGAPGRGGQRSSPGGAPNSRSDGRGSRNDRGAGLDGGIDSRGRSSQGGGNDSGVNNSDIDK